MAVRWDKLTVKAQDAVQTATNLASDNGNPELQPTHLLLALLQDKEGIVTPVLQKAGANPDALRAKTREGARHISQGFRRLQPGAALESLSQGGRAGISGSRQL